MRILICGPRSQPLKVLGEAISHWPSAELIDHVNVDRLEAARERYRPDAIIVGLRADEEDESAPTALARALALVSGERESAIVALGNSGRFAVLLVHDIGIEVLLAMIRAACSEEPPQELDDTTHYASAEEHLMEELRLALLMLRQHLTHSPIDPGTVDEPAIAGLAPNRAQVIAALAAEAAIECPDDTSEDDALDDAIARLKITLWARRRATREAGNTLSFDRLDDIFDLDRTDEFCLMMAMAPTMSRAAQRAVAYLEDDGSRRFVTASLVEAVLERTPKHRHVPEGCVRRAFDAASLLRSEGLLVPTCDVCTASNGQFTIEPHLAQFLMNPSDEGVLLRRLGAGAAEPVALDDVDLVEETNSLATLLRCHDADHGHETKPPRLVVTIESESTDTGLTVALSACEHTGTTTYVLDVPTLVADGAMETTCRLALLACLYRGGVPILTRFEALLDTACDADRSTLLTAICRYSQFAILVSEKRWTPRGTLRDGVHVTLRAGPLDASGRSRRWLAEVRRRGWSLNETEALRLGATFRLTRAQVRDAAREAEHLARWSPVGARDVSMDDIQVACRAQARHHLDEHATRVDPRYRWNDLVLPAAEASQLHELAAHADHAVTVMETWGFADKLSLGRGLTALFHGPSGTGKTMAAEVLAAELGLELYVIDLSRVISKYIGECEKALAAVFDEAETANALLLFDECDALFGKRSEVRDSHDRYANIEVAYLLQRLEAYRGIAVLTTNLRQNMDEAFVRRIRFRVRFHTPTSELRLRIWRGAFPSRAPLSANVDLPFLADSFELTGASIKSAALRAAHLAAADGGVVGSIGMPHIVRAVASELQQLDRPVTADSFGPYVGLLEGNDMSEEEAA